MAPSTKTGANFPNIGVEKILKIYHLLAMYQVPSTKTGANFPCIAVENT
jgi:hypothetical protein